MLKTPKSDLYVYNEKGKFEKIISYEIHTKDSVLIKINNKYYGIDKVELYKKIYNRLHFINDDPIKILNNM